jgi:hypothetical protein
VKLILVYTGHTKLIHKPRERIGLENLNKSKYLQANLGGDK